MDLRPGAGTVAGVDVSAPGGHHPRRADDEATGADRQLVRRVQRRVRVRFGHHPDRRPGDPDEQTRPGARVGQHHDRTSGPLEDHRTGAGQVIDRSSLAGAGALIRISDTVSAAASMLRSDSVPVPDGFGRQREYSRL